MPVVELWSFRLDEYYNCARQLSSKKRILQNVFPVWIPGSLFQHDLITSFMTCSLHQECLGDQIKKDNMCEKYSTNEGIRNA